MVLLASVGILGSIPQILPALTPIPFGKSIGRVRKASSQTSAPSSANTCSKIPPSILP